MQGLVIAPVVHAAGADLGDQGIMDGVLDGVKTPFELSGGQPALPGHIDPLGGGVEVAGLIGPEIPATQGAGQLVPNRDGDNAAPEQAVADMQPGGQLLGGVHDLGLGFPQRKFQKPQRHHVLALPVIGEQRETLHQIDGVHTVLDTQCLAVGGGQLPIRPDGVRQVVEMGGAQPPLPQVVDDIELEHRCHPISMPPWAGASACSCSGPLNSASFSMAQSGRYCSSSTPIKSVRFQRVFSPSPRQAA